MEISVALGGGGVRGAAHIGVLRVLVREGFIIRAVSGTSIGSLIGALYAKGLSPDEIEDLVESVDPLKLYGWPLSDGPGLLGIRGIADWLAQNLGSLTFDDLKIPLAVAAVDLASRREIILCEGLVREAILGSIAVPGIFPPRRLHEYTLIDGGTLDPVPVRAARALAPGLPVVAVPLLPPLDQPSTPMTVPLAVPPQIAEQINRLSLAQALNIFIEAVDIGQREMTELRLRADQPDVLIRPAVGHINMLDRVDVNKVSRIGEQAAQAELHNLRQAISWQARLARGVRNALGRDV